MPFLQTRKIGKTETEMMVWPNIFSIEQFDRFVMLIIIHNNLTTMTYINPVV